MWQLHNNKRAGIGGDFEKIAEMYMFYTFAHVYYTDGYTDIILMLNLKVWTWKAACGQAFDDYSFSHGLIAELYTSYVGINI